MGLFCCFIEMSLISSRNNVTKCRDQETRQQRFQQRRVAESAIVPSDRQLVSAAITPEESPEYPKAEGKTAEKFSEMTTLDHNQEFLGCGHFPSLPSVVIAAASTYCQCTTYTGSLQRSSLCDYNDTKNGKGVGAPVNPT